MLSLRKSMLGVIDHLRWGNIYVVLLGILLSNSILLSLPQKCEANGIGERSQSLGHSPSSTAPLSTSPLSTAKVIMEVPLYVPKSHYQLLVDLEKLAGNRITQEFQQNRTNQLELTVFSGFDGSIIPIFTTTVSRSQWGQFPEVKRWTRYNDIYALLQRPAQPRRDRSVIASIPQGQVPQQSKPQPRMQEGAFDLGYLSGSQIHRNLSHWD